MTRRMVGLVLAVLSWSAGSAALAQGDDDRGRMHYQAGASYYEAGEYEDALREFQRAYNLSQRPALFYNLSLCHQNLGDFTQAASFLERYLAEVEDIANRGNLERRLVNLRARAERAAQATATGTGAAAGTDTATGTGAAAGTGAGSSPATTGPGPTDLDQGGGMPAPALAGFIGGGVGLVMMGTFGALALAEQSSAESCKPTCSSDVEVMDTYALLSDIGLGLAVVGAALGVILLVTDSGEESPAVVVAPVLDGHTAGAAITGSF